MNRPRAYNKHNTLQSSGNQFVLETYDKLIQWKKNSKVLDLGSGDGTTTSNILEPRLPRDYVKLVGSDLQEKMVKYANESNKKPKMGFIQFDIIAEKVLAQKFDHIFSFYAFHWVADLRKAFENVYEMLTPGGDMLISFVDYSPIFNYWKSLSEHPLWGPNVNKNFISTALRRINSEEILKTYLEPNGFINCKIYTKELEHFYVDWIDCLKSVMALDHFVSKLDEEDILEFMLDYVCMVKDAFNGCEQANGEIKHGYVQFVVYASKPE